MDQTFDSGVFTEAQRVSYAIRMLEGSALQWWNSVSRTLSANARASLTWEAFSNKIKTKYCSRGAIQRIERDFLNLKKGNMNIDQYNTAFTEKLQFANKLCPDEESKVARYVEGLPYEYRTSVWSKTTLEAAMEERNSLKMTLPLRIRSWEKLERRGNQRGTHDLQRCSKGIQTTRSTTTTMRKRNVLSVTRGIPESALWRQEDFFVVERRDICKEMGHINTNCPNKKVGSTGGTNTRKDDVPRPKARAFHMTAEEEKVDNESGEANETYAMYATRA
ncbi:reverse transcriptase domain-containing protein [Artemisia annua]|uniref:Reverse transcriptase domain-containing protein n=1 Tax=Artemisia annua TaxID=35608 RepID=A0A2U1KDX7_ARTAN|nr:reverse transcriptase domain-containing protein [Artemisia annua]